MFKPVDPKVDFPKLEEEILKYWKENKIFEKSVESKPKNMRWTFLDGPPFVTGMPHYGHLLGSIHKDVFGRYWTMKGYRVERLWGWDGHGLPIENKVENKLEIKRKKDIEDVIGVKKFIDECRKYVEQISEEWEWYVDHIGRWVDFKNAYKTWDRDYMESVMWVFKQMYDNGFVYKGLKVSLYCPHCSTPISNFEVAMDSDNYKEIQDPATTYKYKLENEDNTYILAWSTTPWNKIVTSALAINPNLVYVKVKQGDDNYILAKSTLGVLGDKKSYEKLEEIKGKDLIGKKFEPHYDYYKEKADSKERIFEIIGGDFVSAEEGTGVVTIAAYGEEDMKAMRDQNIHVEMHLDEEGNVKEDVPQFGGMYYLKANKAVNEDLEKRDLIYNNVEFLHKVPLCWRCHTRLYYAPIDAWYVDIQTLKPLMKKTNEEINWFPKHFKYGRFLKSLENAPDWNISRNRYWGSPVPVWECECGERFVPGSIEELEKASGKTISDLHKPEIDEITARCDKCGKQMRRVPEVLDSWIEAGSASFAERHFPFNKFETLEDFFPPDFIAEYTGQIRAWFYVLHVIGAALYKSPAFKNVGVEGVILGSDGRKMSKNLGNYPDPKELLGKYGGDALRLYLMGSSVMNGEDLIISEEHYRNQVKGMMLVLWNIYNFFTTNANADNWEPKNKRTASKNILDKWILSRLNGNIQNIRDKGYEKYDTPEIIGQAQIFINDLSLWYVRRSRDRVGPGVDDSEDKEFAYETLWFILKEYCKVLAPVIPFITEEIFKNLTNEESVHLSDWPEVDKSLIDNKLEIEIDKQMRSAMNLASVIHSFRKENSLKVKTPLKKLQYKGPLEINREMLKILLDEVNVYDLEYLSDQDAYQVQGDTSNNNQDLDAGRAREVVRTIQAERKKLETRIDEKIDVVLENWPEEFEGYIKKRALVNNLIKGDKFEIKRNE